MDDTAFEALAARHRRELQLHCYRLLGSTQDAEDVTQETLLAAWRGRGAFRGQAAPRTWLYKIATNRSLDALRHTKRRPQSAGPLIEDLPAATHQGEVPWLEPYPDALLEGLADQTASPDARYELHEAVGLAFIVALQALTPRQRAALILRDVLGFSAAESAAMLKTTVAGVNGALNRARRAMAEREPSVRPAVHTTDADRRVLDEFVEAFEEAEIDRVVALLAEDATFAMPPTSDEHRGAEAIARFLNDRFRWRGAAHLTLVPTRANGDPAYGCYLRDPLSPVAWAHGLLVVTIHAGRITALTRFLGDDVLRGFGLPAVLPRNGEAARA
jgi:RNA polymerase sigma-70 factor (ECF subfamily)